MNNELYLIIIFVMAMMLGYELIKKIPPTLHTPLMSGTNAISGIVIIGSILVITGTSNLVFVKNGKVFSPKKNCYIGNTLKFISKKIKINFKDISIKEINNYDEIILIGSGKGVTSVSKIKELNWKRRKNDYYNKLNKIYKSIG